MSPEIFHGDKDFLERTDISKMRNPHLEAAERKASALERRLHINEAVQAIERLIEEARTAPLAKRFSKERIIYSDYPPMRKQEITFELQGKTEEEAKRWRLVHDLEGIKQSIIKLAGRTRDVILDLEASKHD